MAFVRSFDDSKVTALYADKNIRLFKLLENDIFSGAVFPAIRKNEIYFYYEGGCLYKFSHGKFTRNKAYEKFGCTTENASPYEAAKRQIESKFTNSDGGNKERRLLNSLYKHTFNKATVCDTIVLDIEVNLNGTVARGKKCDLVLYYLPLKKLMFVEGKVFTDSRVNVKSGTLPEVTKQVNAYSSAIREQKENIIRQYANYVEIINKLFNTQFPAPQSLIDCAKLLVYDMPYTLTENNTYSINAVTAALGKDNTVWFKQNERPSTDEIWNSLCK